MQSLAFSDLHSLAFSKFTHASSLFEKEGEEQTRETVSETLLLEYSNPPPPF